MRAYHLAHLRDEVLLRELAALVAQDRSTTALLLAHVAEVDARRLYLPAAYPSMHAYCVGALGLSDDAAYRRIQAARAARTFPLLFDAVADGRLHLTAVCLLAPHLTRANVDGLVTAATHRRKAEIELWLARTLGSAASSGSPATASSDSPALDGMAASLALAQVETPVDPGDLPPSDAWPGASAEAISPAPMAASLAPAPVETPHRIIALHLRIGEGTQTKLRHAQELLSHAVPSGDLVEVLDRALDALIEKLETRKFGARAKPLRTGREAQERPPKEDRPGEPPRPHSKPRRHRSLKPRPRSLPAYVRRAVWERDRGQCTFTSESGRRCGSRRRLEFDHIVPVARGGQATLEGLRLRCRGHNQYEAERVFGVAFMRDKRHQREQRNEHNNRDKREDVRPARFAGRAGSMAALACPVAPQARGRAATMPRESTRGASPDHTQDIWAALRGLGFRSEEAHRGSQHAATLFPSTLEEGLRSALQFLAPRSVLRTESRPSTLRVGSRPSTLLVGEPSTLLVGSGPSAAVAYG